MLNESSIVLIGNFNPSIFHPEWFDRFKILPIQEIQWAEGEKPKISEIQNKDRKVIIEEVPPLIVMPDRADLQFPSIKITVIPDRYQCLATQRENFSLMKDVTLKIFTLLSHTPIMALGINFHGHWKFIDDSNEILKSLFAKKDEAFKKTLGDDYNIQGQIIFRKGNQKISLKFEPSNKIQNGIYFGANFHSEIETRRAEQVIQIITENYEKNLNDTIKIVQALLGEPKETWIPKRQKP